MSKQWGGRFDGQTDKLVEALGQSVSYDSRLALHDIMASRAHAAMLTAQGILASGDFDEINQGLDAIEVDIMNGSFVWDVALEDVHTNIEAALVKRIGEAGKRLHTARSRNDQVATDIRLWTRDQIDRIISLIKAMRTALLDLAEAHIHVLLPGYTHMQHAQPVLLAHHLLAYVEMLERDRQRFEECRARVNILPLGSAALAGTPHAIDRHFVANALGFADVTANSMDAVSDRDFLIEFCANAAIAMMHLSRLCEELILWSTSEFGFIEIGDAFTTGSSIMPQKKNPDVAELVRGKTGRVYGNLISLLTMMKGLPLTYNRDLQEDKERVFDTCDTLQLSLEAMAGMLPTIHIHAGAMEAALKEGYLEATDIADYLASKGMPFREAHGVVGKMVRQCAQQGKRLPELTTEEFRAFTPLADDDIHVWLTPDHMAAMRDNPGGTSPARVHAALEEARQRR